MIDITTHDSSGRILERKTLKDEAEADLNHPEEGGWVPGHYHSAEHFVEDGEIQPRPSLDIPDHLYVKMSDNEKDFTDLPEETAVRYDGMTAGESDSEGVRLIFEHSGSWEIHFDPPFPHKPATVTVEVEND